MTRPRNASMKCPGILTALVKASNPASSPVNKTPVPKKRRRGRMFAPVMIMAGLLLVTGFSLLNPWRYGGLKDDLDDVRLDRIIAFAQRSNAAYHEAEIFRREYGQHIEAGEFPLSGLRVYIDNNPSGPAQWVIMRGTANMADICDDLDFVDRSEHELGINVHEGFDRTLQECLPWILQRIDKTRPVWVTGHSLGGAVAALLVAVLDHRGFGQVSAITFGQPKFTDAQGAAKLSHLDILRIVHDEDPVPMLPPVDMNGIEFALYQHFGPEVIIRATGHFYYLPEHRADRLDVSQLLAEIRNIRPISHDMTRGYLPALKNALADAAHLRLAAPVNASLKKSESSFAH